MVIISLIVIRSATVFLANMLYDFHFGLNKLKLYLLGSGKIATDQPIDSCQ